LNLFEFNNPSHDLKGIGCEGSKRKFLCGDFVTSMDKTDLIAVSDPIATLKRRERSQEHKISLSSQDEHALSSAHL